MATDRSKLLNEIFAGTLSRTGDWLKFAETKNAALLTFSSAWLLALGNAILGDNALSATQRHALAVSGCFLLLCSGLCLYALVPRIRLKKADTPTTAISLLKYSDLQHLTGEQIYNKSVAIFSRGLGEEYSDAYLMAVTREISDLSKIAARKYSIFNAAVSNLAAAPLAGFIYLLWAT